MSPLNTLQPVSPSGDLAFLTRSLFFRNGIYFSFKDAYKLTIEARKSNTEET